MPSKSHAIALLTMASTASRLQHAPHAGLAVPVVTQQVSVVTRESLLPMASRASNSLSWPSWPRCRVCCNTLSFADNGIEGLWAAARVPRWLGRLADWCVLLSPARSQLFLMFLFRGTACRRCAVRGAPLDVASGLLSKPTKQPTTEQLVVRGARRWMP